VFTDANVIEGTNYDCDDSATVRAKIVAYYDERKDCFTADHLTIDVASIINNNLDTIVKAALEGAVPCKTVKTTDPIYTDTDEFEGITLYKVVATTSGGTTTTVKTPFVVDSNTDLAAIIASA
jgi:hypothetical protein